MTRIWITRASPGAEATAARVRALGIEAVVAPLLEVKILPATIDLSGVAALAFTSANAARAFAGQSERRDLPVFAVGAATAQAARMAGFAQIQSAHGDVAALVRLIAASSDTLGGAVLHPGASEPAGDLDGALGKAGVMARAMAIYETVPAEIPEGVLDSIGSIDAVLLHSPRAGRRLAEILKGRPAPNLTAYCLSREVSATLTNLDLRSVTAAALPTEDALLSLIDRIPPGKAT